MGFRQIRPKIQRYAERLSLNCSPGRIYIDGGVTSFLTMILTGSMNQLSIKWAQNHQLGFSGGNNKTTYSLSLNYRDDQGLLKTSYLKRYSTRFSIDDQVKKWLRIGGTLSYNNQAENLVDINDAVARQMVEDFPFLPVKYPDGTYANNRDYPQAEGTFSSVHRLNGVNTTRTRRLRWVAFMETLPLHKGLEFRSVLGVNVINQEINESSTRTLSISEFGTAGKETVKRLSGHLKIT
jgi:hypothetical protein